MMKKIFNLILLSFIPFLLSGCYFSGYFYNEVPEFRKDAYKKEMEQIIASWVAKSKAIVDDDVVEIQKLRNDIVANKPVPNSEECINITATDDFVVSEALLPVYAELVTKSGKYFKTDESVLHTDWYGTPADYIEPILKANNVDMSGLDEITEYAEAASVTVKGYLEDVSKICSWEEE